MQEASRVMDLIGTRRRSAFGTHPPLHNRRRPKVGEYVRVLIKSSSIHNNIHTHGWIIIEVEKIYVIIPEDNWGEDYLVQGKLYECDKIIHLQLSG